VNKPFSTQNTITEVLFSFYKIDLREGNKNNYDNKLIKRFSDLWLLYVVISIAVKVKFVHRETEIIV
jgi:hypothetical protein